MNYGFHLVDLCIVLEQDTDTVDVSGPTRSSQCCSILSVSLVHIRPDVTKGLHAALLAGPGGSSQKGPTVVVGHVGGNVANLKQDSQSLAKTLSCGYQGGSALFLLLLVFTVSLEDSRK